MFNWFGLFEKKDLRIIFLFLKTKENPDVCFLECISIYDIKKEKKIKTIKTPIDLDVAFDSTMIEGFSKILNESLKNNFIVKKELQDSQILKIFLSILRTSKKRYKDINGVILDSI